MITNSSSSDVDTFTSQHFILHLVLKNVPHSGAKVGSASVCSDLVTAVNNKVLQSRSIMLSLLHGPMSGLRALAWASCPAVPRLMVCKHAVYDVQVPNRQAVSTTRSHVHFHECCMFGCWSHCSYVTARLLNAI